MTVKNILSLACVFLNLDDLLLTSQFVVDGVAINEAQQKKLNSLVQCLNLVLDEIATDYVPILNHKTLEVSNEKIEFNDISPNFLEVTSLKCENYNNVFAKEYAGYFAVPNGKYYIDYKERPLLVEFLGNAPTYSQFIPARVFAYGVAMEYYLISNMSDEASVWESRYKDALLIIARGKRERRIPARRW